MKLSLLFAGALLVAAAQGCSTAAGSGEDAAGEEDELRSRKSLFANDVSILFPLPTGAERDLLLGATSSGARGELVPQATMDRLPRLVPEGASREDLRVVAARIDPCFPGLGVDDPGGCKNQIRLVLQPVAAQGGAEPVSAKDAAVHAFYTMSREELTEVAKALLAAKHGARGSKRTSLGPHPLLVEQGLAGPFAEEVKSAILAHAGAENLTRVTFMTREAPRQPQWKFGGFDIDRTTHTAMEIASLGGATEQTFTTLMRNGRAEPQVAHEDDLSLLFSAFSTDAATEDERERAYTAALRVLNPGMHSPDTVDCVSCHTATSARIFAESKGHRPDGNEAAFVTAWNVALTKSPAAPRADNLHAFGYLGTEASVSQRVANESVVVAEYVNAKILGVR